MYHLAWRYEIKSHLSITTIFFESAYFQIFFCFMGFPAQRRFFFTSPQENQNYFFLLSFNSWKKNIYDLLSFNSWKKNIYDLLSFILEKILSDFTFLSVLNVQWNFHEKSPVKNNPSLAEHNTPCLSKQCRSRSVGFFRSQLIWICTVCH